MLRHLRFPLTLLALTTLLLIQLASCGGDDGTTPQDTSPPEALASGTVDAAGGQIVDDTAVLTVPAGALDGAVDLALHEDDEPGPFAGLQARVLRVEGIPYQLGAPLELRFRHGLTVAEGDSLGVFLGEEREAYDGDPGLYWHAIAGRDSAGWCIATLERGAFPLPGKSEAAVRVINAPDVAITYIEGGHIRIIYRTSEVEEEPVGNLLMNFESAYTSMTLWGWQFGQGEDYWPRDVILCEPPGTWACFIPGPAARGHFEIDPEYVLPGGNLLPVAMHEFFHLVQSFYDPRDPSQWGTMNEERLWLDEATAAWLEATTTGLDNYYPGGMDGDNMMALLYGFNGTDKLETADYGYGMSNFIRYWLEDPVNGQGEDRLLTLFEHFREHGDAGAALEAAWNPDPTGWVLDMQRKLMAMELYPYDPEGVVWWAWNIDGYLRTGLGESEQRTRTVADLGSFLCKFFIEGASTEPLTALKVRAVQDDPVQPAEHLPLTVYGRPEGEPLVLLAAGVDSLTVPDWTAVVGSYKDLLILATRPYLTAPGLEGARDITVSAEVVMDGSALNLAEMNAVSIEVRTDNTFNTGDPVPNDIIGVRADVAWNGSGFVAVTATDTFTIAVDAEALTVGSWYASERGTTVGGNYFVRRLGGTGAVFDTYDTDSYIFRVQGEETCDRLTHVFESLATEENTPPYRYLVGFDCHDGGVSYDRSGIYMHFYR